MKRVSLILLVSAAIISGCTQKTPSYTVKGTLPDSSYVGKTLYMVSVYNDRKVDSTLVDGQSFMFLGVIDTAEICRIQLSRQQQATFVLENGELEVDFDTRKATSTMPLNRIYNDLQTQQDSLMNLYKEKMEALKETTEDREVLSEQMGSFYKTEIEPVMVDMYKTAFQGHTNDVIGVYALNMLYSNRILTSEEFDELLVQAGDIVLNNNAIQRAVKTNDAIKNTAEGKPFVDFTIDQKDGSTISFSHYIGKGKYVLVDFWASWCGPCIAETPVIAEVYKKYKGKNFEVLGVAVWDKPEKTQEAIVTHKITWPQIPNAQTIPTDLYGISGIPQIMLFGPDGTIVKRDLRGDGIKEAVAEALGK